MIVVTDYDVAQDTAARLAAGEDFASVAQDVSVDTGSGDNGGDLGWLPPVIISDYGNLIASLEIGGVTAPLAYYSESTTSSTSSTTPSAYYIFMVSEKESDRELDDDNLVILQNMALDLWLDEEIPKHEITYDFDSEMYSWMCWQLEKE
jgi:parvulin-like peptidyl-prolyl isomerase